MEGSAYREHHSAACAPGLAQRGGLLYSRRSAGDYRLPGRIKVGSLHDLSGLGRDLGAGLDNLGRVQLQHCCHGSLAGWNGDLHRPAASLNGAKSVGKAHGSGNDVRRPLAQRVSGSERRFYAVLGQNACCRNADGHNRRLGIFGQPQVLFRTLKAQLRQRKAERVIGLGKGLCCYRKTLGKLAAHADRL